MRIKPAPESRIATIASRSARLRMEGELSRLSDFSPKGSAEIRACVRVHRIFAGIDFEPIDFRGLARDESGLFSKLEWTEIDAASTKSTARFELARSMRMPTDDQTIVARQLVQIVWRS